MSDSVITSETALDPFAGMTVESTYSGPTEAPSETSAVDETPAVLADTPETTEKPEAKADATERNADGTFKAKPKKGSLDRLIWEREEAERKATAAELKAAAFEAQLARQAQPTPEPAKQAAPAFAPFEEWSKAKPEASYEDYLDARADWRLEQRMAEKAKQDAAQRDHTEFLTATERYVAAETAMKETHDDYDQVLASGAKALRLAGLNGLPDALLKAIHTSTRGPELLYSLASHPEDCIQLAQEAAGLPLTAAPMMRRLLESRLTAAPSGPAVTPKPAISQAKPPIKPVGSAPSGTESPDDDPEDIDTFIRVNNAREAKARR